MKYQYYVETHDKTINNPASVNGWNFNIVGGSIEP